MCSSRLSDARYFRSINQNTSVLSLVDEVNGHVRVGVWRPNTKPAINQEDVDNVL